MKKRAKANGRKQRAKANGRAGDDLEEMFRRINTPRPDPAAPDPADDEAGKAAALAALADGSLLAPGADGLDRLGRAVAAGWLDDASEVSDARRRQIIAFVSERLRAGDPAEKVAAAACFDQILARPGARPVPAAACPGRPASLPQAGSLAGGSPGRGPPGAEPSASGAGGAEPAPGGGGPDPLVSDLNGAAEADDPRRVGRDRRGKFTPGNACARGNPSNRRAAALRGALFQDLNEDRMRRLFKRAMAGDLEATKLVLLYAVGKPREAPDADRLDLMEFQLLAAGPSLTKLWLAINEAVDPAFACAIWRQLSCASADAGIDQMLGVVQAEPARFAENLRAERRALAGK
jgi:hypothetical protein